MSAASPHTPGEQRGSTREASPGTLKIFERAFTSGTGFYRWQQRLLEEFLHSVVPSAVDVPPGLGKTKVIAAWLTALALGAALPRRLVYVVDRRAVVDQASAEAAFLSEALDALLNDTSVDELQRTMWSTNLGLRPGDKLPVSTLRGQFVDNRHWLDNPHSAAIIVGTVDMVGSRLLFSGYGVTRGMRPVQAALLACDAYVVLDEAHLVPAFEELLSQIKVRTQFDRANAPLACVPEFASTALSATGRDRGGHIFRLDDEDLNDAPVRVRLHAEKRLWLLSRVESAHLAVTLAERAWELGQPNRRVLVFANSRKVAQEVAAILDVKAKQTYPDQTLTELLVGERRIRERLAAYPLHADPAKSLTIVQRFLPGGESAETPLFLIATSAGEVGIDLDADDIVCDLVAWERMVQRLGRVNRRPNPGSARIEVVPCTSDKDKDAEDSIAAERLDILEAPFRSADWPTDSDGSHDASPQALRMLKMRIAPVLDRATTPAPYYPELADPLIEAWAMTSLAEHRGRPIVQPWLRGWNDQEPQATVLWRAYMPLHVGWNKDFKQDATSITTDLNGYFAAAPPHLTEMLDAPASRLAALIKERTDRWKAEGEPDRFVLHEPAIVILNQADEVHRVLTLDEIRQLKADRLAQQIAGRVVVFDARLGGLDSSGLLDLRGAKQPMTIDRDESGGNSDDSWWRELGEQVERPFRIRVGERRPLPSGSTWKFEGFRWILDADDPESQELWIEVRRDSNAAGGDPAVARRAQALSEHHQWARDQAEIIGNCLRLPSEKVRLLALAAGYHDTGKKRELWQNAMNAKSDGRPYAKTTGGGVPGALGGYRHEFGSLVDALDDPEISELFPDDRELALHLIAAHHGYVRPSVAGIDPDTPPSKSDQIARDAALRWAKLQRAWGPWGLAWWESLLRCADWSASRRLNSDV